MQYLNGVSYYLAYAFGYSAGTYVGILIEEKMAKGRVITRIITKKDATELIEGLRSTGYDVASSMLLGYWCSQTYLCDGRT